MNIDYSKISDIEFDAIDLNDAPDYTDAYISSAYYDGTEMSDEFLDLLNENREYIHNKLMDYLN